MYMKVLAHWRRLAQFVFVITLLVVLVLSLAPLEQPTMAPNDKVNHLIAYATLTVMGVLGFRRMLMIAIVVVSWGAMIEWLQGLTPYRMMSGYDMLANSAGVVLGCVVILVCEFVQKKAVKNEAEANSAGRAR